MLNLFFLKKNKTTRAGSRERTTPLVLAHWTAVNEFDFFHAYRA